MAFWYCECSELDPPFAELLIDYVFSVVLGGESENPIAVLCALSDGGREPRFIESGVRILMEDREADGMIAYFMNTGTEIVARKKCAAGGLYAGAGE